MINDPTHIMFGAFSTETKKLYWYDEYRVNNSDVKTIAKGYRAQYKMNGTNLKGLLMMPRFDGRSWNKRESDLTSIGGMFQAEGLWFEPSFASIEARIIKMNALINHDQMEVFSTCEFFIEEMLNYKFKLDKNGNPTKKPEDGNDHGITAAGFVVAELPHNLRELKLSAYLPSGSEFIHDKKLDLRPPNQANIYNPLKEDDSRDHNVGYHNNLIVTEHTATSLVHSIFDELEDEDRENEMGGPLAAYVPNHR